MSTMGTEAPMTTTRSGPAASRSSRSASRAAGSIGIVRRESVQVAFVDHASRLALTLTSGMQELRVDEEWMSDLLLAALRPPDRGTELPEKRDRTRWRRQPAELLEDALRPIGYERGEVFPSVVVRQLVGRETTGYRGVDLALAENIAKVQPVRARVLFRCDEDSEQELRPQLLTVTGHTHSTTRSDVTATEHTERASSSAHHSQGHRPGRAQFGHSWVPESIKGLRRAAISP